MYFNSFDETAKGFNVMDWWYLGKGLNALLMQLSLCDLGVLVIMDMKSLMDMLC